MISMDEMLCHKKLEDLTAEQQANVQKLYPVVCKLRELWGKPMTPTNCVRTMDEHIKIYMDKAKKAGVPFDKSKVPMKSKHLFGQALDIADPGLVITAWLKANPHVLEECNIYCEQGNKNWVHLQIVPFGSYKSGGTRWFLP